MTRMQRVMIAWSFHNCLMRKTFPRNTCETFCLAIFVMSVLPSLYPHYIYLHYPQYIPSLPTYCKECFHREYPSIHTWELENIIPTIIYTFPCDFPLLLPLHIQIFERLIAQTLTTPNLSVKWVFDTAGKHWKKPIVGGCNRVELRDPGKLKKTRFWEASW